MEFNRKALPVRCGRQEPSKSVHRCRKVGTVSSSITVEVDPCKIMYNKFYLNIYGK